MNNTKGTFDYRVLIQFKQKKPKQAEIATETPKTATNDLDTIKTPYRATDRKIQHDSAN